MTIRKYRIDDDSRTADVVSPTLANHADCTVLVSRAQKHNIVYIVTVRRYTILNIIVWPSSRA